ncbi:HTH-type transcriptional regulator CynR [Sporomusa rhizae]|uniref:LysR family transcriptional regulator n=1 Tax=Sporomusa rhizae TaxID=357999 RepID=UPI00352BBE2E
MLGFKIASELKSISKAAKELFITPQGLGKIIQNLERELDAKLLIRTSQGIELTDAGVILKEKADFLIKELENIQKDFEIRRNREHGKIHLVSSYGIMRYYSPNCILEFKKKYPNIDFTYEEYPDIIIDQMMENMEADVGFAIEPVDEKKFEKTTLKTFKPQLLVRKEHPLAGRNLIIYKDLDSLNMIIESKKFKINHIFLDKCRKHNVAPNILFETSGFSLCHKLCKTNDYASVTIDFISEDMKDSNLTLIPFDDKELTWSFCFIRKKNTILSDAGKVFYDFIYDWNKKMK